MMDSSQWEGAQQLLEEGMQNCSNDVFFRQRLAICYFHTHHHDKMMENIRAVAVSGTEYLNTLLSVYPELNTDPEVMELVRHLSDNT
jgi:hypothetical protein